MPTQPATGAQARRGGLNPKMFNSFLDGSKPAIESTAVANATGLTPAPDGLAARGDGGIQEGIGLAG